VKSISLDPYKLDQARIREIAQALLEGKIVGLPTETVYGLGVVFDNQEAIERLYKIKKRPPDKALALHFDDIEAAEEMFTVLPPFGYRLIEKFWPGPLTIVFQSRKGDKKIGIRIPSHFLLRTIIKAVRKPLYLPSANISGEKEATSAQEIAKVFNGNVDLVVDAGPPVFFKPSTVVDLTYHPFKVLREGVISAQDITRVFLRKRIIFVCTGNTCRSVMAHFMLEKLLKERPYLRAKYEILSAGVAASEGSAPTFDAIKVMRETSDVDVQSHASRRLSRKLIRSADLIFVMEVGQRDFIKDLDSTARERVFPLSLFLPEGKEQDIADPIGRPYDFYQEVHGVIQEGLHELMEWL